MLLLLLPAAPFRGRYFYFLFIFLIISFRNWELKCLLSPVWVNPEMFCRNTTVWRVASHEPMEWPPSDWQADVSADVWSSARTGAEEPLPPLLMESSWLSPFNFIHSFPSSHYFVAGMFLQWSLNKSQWQQAAWLKSRWATLPALFAVFSSYSRDNCVELRPTSCL